MKYLRKGRDRGQAEHGWLHSRHTFSFGDYYDPKHMGFGALRVINEDRIDGGTGFGTHGHRDMEIISYVIEGALEHQDSMGNKTLIKPGEIQRMSAGTGVRHSEYNHLKDQQTHFLQIWIMPDKNGHAPSYGQMGFQDRLHGKDILLLASPKGREGSITLNQDAEIYVGKSARGGDMNYPGRPGRHLWFQVIKGEVKIAGEALEAGDGLGLVETTPIAIQMNPGVEFLIFDVPA